jgi:hypothetical protein
MLLLCCCYFSSVDIVLFFEMASGCYFKCPFRTYRTVQAIPASRTYKSYRYRNPLARILPKDLRLLISLRDSASPVLVYRYCIYLVSSTRMSYTYVRTNIRDSRSNVPYRTSHTSVTYVQILPVQKPARQDSTKRLEIVDFSS